MMFNYLPEDLVVEILSRVPAVSLARLRSTSKKWNALIKDGRLAKKHSANAPRHSMALVLIDHMVYSVRSNLPEIHNNVAPFVSVTCHLSLKERLSKHFSTEVDIRDVFHCDGLLLCTTKDYRLVVWNPCSGETRWIQPRDSYKKDDCYALERFGSESLPEDDSHLALSVTRQGKQLCMLSTHSSYVTETNVNLWIATKSENTGAMSWRKFPILHGVGLRYRYHFREGVSFFAYQVKEKIVVVSCHRPNRYSKDIIHIVGHGKFIELDHHGAKPTHEWSPTPVLLVYVPSLVQIQHGI
ncbi:F-box associated domain type 1 [Arabidopsis thaliana x Arabidopsis arenosa]|uniref:F-box associated domain type 1 n=1 Tax=Arabidopsis thaliana x Arabidopsis arenosa TaxID=1240361 RepID=A0A8T2AVC2_9BRAS|nr:F-box associated domain type 1 [Arabidopsis thaliana x Arabidopsis arenosa]